MGEVWKTAYIVLLRSSLSCRLLLMLLFIHHPFVNDVQGMDQEVPDTHRLMPGIRSRELHNVDWPRTYHDKLVTGFSPLSCGMTIAPSVWSKIRVDTTVDWVQTVVDNVGHQRLLVYDGALRLVSPEGKVLWTNQEVAAARSANAALLFCGDLRDNGTTCILIADGRFLTLIDAETGDAQWSHLFEPSYVQLFGRPWSLAVADIRPDLPGSEAAVFPLYSERGYLIGFPPHGAPEILWDVLAVVPGEHAASAGNGERADHGCWTQVDLSDPQEPIIWNVRHHRCRGFDPKTGEIISTLVYDIGGGQKRNYGPARLGFGAGGSRLMCVASEAVQFHVHAIGLNRAGPSELLWQKYYGELLLSGKPGRRELRTVIIDDIDFDGLTEIAYNVTDEDRNLRSFFTVRDAESGNVEVELADCKCEHALIASGTRPATWLVIRPTEANTIDKQDLLLYRLSDEAEPVQIAHWPQASLWGLRELTENDDPLLLVRKTDEQGIPRVEQIAFDTSTPTVVDHTDASAIVPLNHIATVRRDDGSPIFVAAPSDGVVRGFDFDGALQWTLEVESATPGMVSAADLDGDHRAELVATVPTDQRVHIYRIDDGGHAELVRSHPHWCSDTRVKMNPLSPLLYDLLGNGSLCLICPGQNSTGHSVVRAFRADGGLVWATVLDSEQPAGPPTRWHAGNFLPDGRAAVVVSSHAPQGESIQGTYLLDGKTGEIVWQRGGYLKTHEISLPHYPNGVPTGFDLDGDGAEEIGMDFYCYMAWMRGVDGEFHRLHHTSNLGVEDSLYAGRFHNSYIPVFPGLANSTSRDGVAPHWFVPVGLHGATGLMRPDPTEGVWRDDFGYDMPRKIGMVDVDGDGKLEVGYTPYSQATFTCRDLESGDIEWQLDLPEPPESPVISGDLDGDGRGEFLVGRYCVGVDAGGRGEVRWTAPERIYFPAIADFDGDGQGEIAGFGKHGIRVLKAR